MSNNKYEETYPKIDYDAGTWIVFIQQIGWSQFSEFEKLKKILMNNVQGRNDEIQLHACDSNNVYLTEIIV